MIRLSKSSISSREEKYVQEVLSKEFLGMGEEVVKFEKSLKNFFGREVVCVSSGTAALHLALEACNIGKGDEVLVPSLTYVASFQAISATGAIPISCDVEDKFMQIDLLDAKKKINDSTKAIMPVHYSGGSSNLSEVYNLASLNNLRVIEDAAHAFGSKYNSKLIGSFGDISCFSFDGIKNITSGEGGCIVSGDKSIISFAKDARLLGVENDSDKRSVNDRSFKFDVKIQGWRYHMSNIMAAIGLAQLERFSEFKKNRQELAKYYTQSINKLSNKLYCINWDYNEVVPHIFPIRIKVPFNRNKLMSDLLDLGIQVGIHYQPNHLLSKYSNNQNPLPITDEIHNQMITLPLHNDLTKKDVDFILTSLNSLLIES